MAEKIQKILDNKVDIIEIRTTFSNGKVGNPYFACSRCNRSIRYANDYFCYYCGAEFNGRKTPHFKEEK